MNRLATIIDNKTSEQTARFMYEKFDGSSDGGENAAKAVILLKSQIPMYEGNLNPKWEFWDDVLVWLKDYNEDLQVAYFLGELKKS